MGFLQKLKLKPGKSLCLLHVPEECLFLFDGVDASRDVTQPLEQFVLFSCSSAELMRELNALLPFIGTETLCWICYPKKSGTISSDLALDSSWEPVFQLGFRGQTSISVDSNWSGFRVTTAAPIKPTTYDKPPEERKSEGIDYVSRTALLPPDALEMLNAYQGLTEYFYSLAFTHKKEHVLAITEAKQPTTRQRRIEKMIEMLQRKAALNK